MGDFGRVLGNRLEIINQSDFLTWRNGQFEQGVKRFYRHVHHAAKNHFFVFCPRNGQAKEASVLEVFVVCVEVVAIAQVDEVDETADGSIFGVDAVNSDGCQPIASVATKIAFLNVKHGFRMVVKSERERSAAVQLRNGKN